MLSLKLQIIDTHPNIIYCIHAYKCMHAHRGSMDRMQLPQQCSCGLLARQQGPQSFSKRVCKYKLEFNVQVKRGVHENVIQFPPVLEESTPCTVTKFNVDPSSTGFDMARRMPS